MLILTQNKKRIINLDQVFMLEADENKIYAKGQTDRCAYIGKYNSEVRAIEVLKEIFKANDYQMNANAHADWYGNTQLSFNVPASIFEMPMK